MHLIQRIREESKQHGTIVYNWALAELLNDKDVQKVLTKSDKEAIVRVFNKIEKQHR
jgi:hypothetical protein